MKIQMNYEQTIIQMIMKQTKKKEKNMKIYN